MFQDLGPMWPRPQYPYPQGGSSWYRLYRDMQGRMDKRAEYDRWYAGEHGQQNPYYDWAKPKMQVWSGTTDPDGRVAPPVSAPQPTQRASAQKLQPPYKPTLPPTAQPKRQTTQARTMKQQAPKARKQSVQPRQWNPRTKKYEGGRR